MAHGRDPRQQFPPARAASDLGVRAGFGFPVLAGADVVAVLEFFSSQAVEPDEPLLQAMAHMGTQLGRVFDASGRRKSAPGQASGRGGQSGQECLPGQHGTAVLTAHAQPVTRAIVTIGKRCL